MKGIDLTQNSKLKTQSSDVKTESFVDDKSNLRRRSYKFSISIIRYLDTLPNKKVFWVITDQLLRSATSIGANIIEAKAASSKKDFINFYTIALKSANETIYWLNLLMDATDMENEPIEILLNEADEISRMLGSSIITMKKSL